MFKTHEYFMQKAIIEAQKAEKLGEVPIGAIITDGQKIIARGHNRSIIDHDPTAHDEIVALRAAGKKLKNYRLNDLTIYVTLEPCPMCKTALRIARVKTLVFGTKTEKIASNHKIEVIDNISQTQCSLILKTFFENKR